MHELETLSRCLKPIGARRRAVRPFRTTLPQEVRPQRCIQMGDRYFYTSCRCPDDLVFPRRRACPGHISDSGAKAFYLKGSVVRVFLLLSCLSLNLFPKAPLSADREDRCAPVGVPAVVGRSGFLSLVPMARSMI